MTTLNTPPAKRAERHVGRKLWIREVLEGNVVSGGEAEPNTLKTARGQANRVNLMGVVVDTQELPVSSITIDDGSGTILVRSFEQKLAQQIGGLVQVIGRPRAYQGEMYIAAEAVAALPSAWAAYRKTELGEVLLADIEVKTTASAEPSAPTQSEETRVERIIALIRQLDEGSGAPIEAVIAASRLTDAEALIEQLLLHGDIFELRPGKVKVL
jgi:RPA family protein